jgi:hypothetical protein
MCEAAFPDDVDPDAFESHVVEHFCFEEAETIKYIMPTALDLALEEAAAQDRQMN